MRNRLIAIGIIWYLAIFLSFLVLVKDYQSFFKIAFILITGATLDIVMSYYSEKNKK